VLHGRGRTEVAEGRDRLCAICLRVVWFQGFAWGITGLLLSWSGSVSVALAPRPSQSSEAVQPIWMLYDALTGLLEAGLDRAPRAVPWATLFRPVGAWRFLPDGALKGRHIIAQGNALGPNRIESSKP
jgi:hypothetical protein